MQVSGVRYTFDASKQGLERLVEATLADGSPIDPEKLYTVIMPDFIAMGGDGTETVMRSIPADRVQIHYAAPVRDIIIEQLKTAAQPMTPKLEGRINVVNPAPAR